MSDLTRKDVWQTVGQAVSAYALAVGVVAVGVWWYFSLVSEVVAQQDKVEDVEDRVEFIQARMQTVQEDIESLKGDITLILQLLQEEQEAD